MSKSKLEMRFEELKVRVDFGKSLLNYMVLGIMGSSATLYSMIKSSKYDITIFLVIVVFIGLLYISLGISSKIKSYLDDMHKIVEEM